MPDMRLAAINDRTAGACVLVPGEGNRKVSVTVVAENAVAGLRFDPAAGTHKGIQLLVDADVNQVQLLDEDGEVTATVLPPGEVRLSAEIVGTSVTGYMNGELIGTKVAEKPDALNTYLACSGRGSAVWTSICTEPISE